MGVQVHIGSDLTAEQHDMLDTYYTAQKILRAAGIQAKVVRCVTTSPEDDPAYITIGGGV